MMKRTLTISFDSDWHIGSGAGIPGSVDRQVLRDQDGLPYIPAKTLTGMLRDAAEWLVENGGYDKTALKALLGHQPKSHGGQESEVAQEARLWVRPARIPESLRSKLEKDPELRDALFLIQPHVRISRETGRAKDDHLFSVELVRAEIPLEADVFLNVLDDDKEESLLEGAVKAVRRMGGKRRRGGGKCTLGWRENWSDIATDAPTTSTSVGEDFDWYSAPVRLEALEALQIPLETLGNTVEGRDFIPGYLLLPHLAKALGPAAGAFIVKGDIQVSNLTPVVGGQAGLPVPMCLFANKEAGDSKTALNRAVKEAGDDSPQLRGLREGYVAPMSDGGLAFGKTDKMRTLRMHNTVEDESQRPTEAVGGVFSYGAMIRGSQLMGSIRVSKKAFGVFNGKQLSGEVRLGRSKKDDYGRAKLIVNDFVGLKQESISLYSGSTLVVYLESDVLIRDERLAYSADPRHLQAALEKELPGIGLSLESRGDIDAVGRARRHDSWQTRWNLPRPSLVALRAGSVYVFKVSGIWEPFDVERLTLRGVGERLAEGFGRVQFNPAWLLEEDITLNEHHIEPHAKAERPETGAGEHSGFLNELLLVKWQRTLRREARQKAYQTSVADKYLGAGKGPDAPSQWGSLREAAARISDDYESGKDQLYAWADPRCLQEPHKGEDWPDKRRKAWGELRDKIKELAQAPSKVWVHFASAESIEDEIKAKLWGFAVRTLLDYMCEAALDHLGKKQKDKQKNGAHAHAGNNQGKG